MANDLIVVSKRKSRQNRLHQCIDALENKRRIKVLQRGNDYKGERRKRYQKVLDFNGQTVWYFVRCHGVVATLMNAVKNKRVALV